ncbi:MAG: hypothetical protein ACLRVT_04780 [Oscillospiraceae bacterium]
MLDKMPWGLPLGFYPAFFVALFWAEIPWQAAAADVQASTILAVPRRVFCVSYTGNMLSLWNF